MLLASVLLILFLPPIQAFLSQKTADYLSKEWKTEVTLKGIYVSPFLDVVVRDLKINDQNHQPMLEVPRLEVSVARIDLRQRIAEFKKLSLYHAKANVLLAGEERELNLQFMIDYFSGSDTTQETTPSKPWKILCPNVDISKTNFTYRNEPRMDLNARSMDYANLVFTGIDLKLRNLAIVNDTIFAQIEQLSAKEKCGIHLKEFSAQAVVSPREVVAKNLKIKTENSQLSLDLRFSYNNWNAYLDFIDSVKVSSTIRTSSLSMKDIAFFAPGIAGMNDRFVLSGNVKGSVASFSGKSMDVSYGLHTRFRGNVELTGLPDWEKTYADLDISELKASVDDIKSFSLPGGQSIAALPDEVQVLNKILVKGRFTGFYNNFTSRSSVTTDAGSILTDIKLGHNADTKTLYYDGHVVAQNFDIGKILHNENIGSLSINANINGQGFDPAEAKFTLKGDIKNAELYQTTLNDIHVDGSYDKKKFTGFVLLYDELGFLDFEGEINYADSIPEYNFSAELKNVLPTHLGLWKRDSTEVFSTKIRLNGRGHDFKDFQGTVAFTDLTYREGEKEIVISNLFVENKALSPTTQEIQIQSDVVDATLKGDYLLADFGNYYHKIFSQYLPSIFDNTATFDDFVSADLEFDIRLKNTQAVTGMFFPRITLADQTTLLGNYHSNSNRFQINIESPYLNLYGVSLRDVAVEGATRESTFYTNLKAHVLDLNPSETLDTSIFNLEQFEFRTTLENNILDYSVQWNDLSGKDFNIGLITGELFLDRYPEVRFKIAPSAFTVNDSVWAINQGNDIVLDSMGIAVRNLVIQHQDQLISLSGQLSHDPLDQMKLELQNYDLTQLGVLFDKWGVGLGGLLSGSVMLSSVYETPNVESQITIKSFVLNDEKFGDAEIFSAWNPQKQSIDLDTKIRHHGNVSDHFPVSLTGSIFPQDKKNNLDLSVELDNFRIKALSPFFKGLFSRVKGLGSGNLTLKGTFGDPQLEGLVKLVRSELTVDYLKTPYSLSGDINFSKNLISFSDVKFSDSISGKGSASGKIKHKGFRDWNLDITVNADKLLALNTGYSFTEQYYGKAFVTGDFTLKGPINDLRMKINATSEKGTQLYLPISYSVSISDNDFIQYVSKSGGKDTVDKKVEIPVPVEKSNLTLDMAINATRDAAVEIILPYQMGNIKARGEGPINMALDTRGGFNLTGQYIMDQGSFLFSSLQGFFSRTFDIKKGSTITFNGSTDNIDIKMTAVYKLETSMGGIPEFANNPDYANRSIPVDCYIYLTNSLYNPDIRFSIQLPDVDAETQRMVYKYLDTANVSVLNQQVISLLVLNTFTSGSDNVTLSSSIGASSLSILTSQVSGFLSQLTKRVDIGVKYRPGDAVSSDEIGVAMSTQLLNNRLIINGGVGVNSYGNSSQQVAEYDNNNWVLDLNIEYKITEDGRIRAKAFNKTNNSLDMSSYQSPYTQGVGVVFRKRFNKLPELFVPQKRK